MLDRAACCATADGQNGPASLVACAAKRWLARNAAGVKRISSQASWDAEACISLVSCLPTLNNVKLSLTGRLTPDNVGCLLEALAFCPRLTALHLVAEGDPGDSSDTPWPSPHAFGFAKLRSLTKLVLEYGEEESYYALANAMDALVSLKCLAELTVPFYGDPALVPASLGQLQTLRSLELGYLEPGVLEAGCLDLPNLLSLTFQGCHFMDTEVLPGVSALRSLTRIEFLDGQGPRFFDRQLSRLPQLQHAVFETGGSRTTGDICYDTTDELRGSGACL